jgi:hypothetical protein
MPGSSGCLALMVLMLKDNLRTRTTTAASLPAWSCTQPQTWLDGFARKRDAVLQGFLGVRKIIWEASSVSHRALEVNRAVTWQSRVSDGLLETH